MHFIITDAWLAKSRAIHLSGTKLVAGHVVALSLVLMLMAAGLYHWVFLKGAREGWPVIGTLVRLVVKDEFEQRDRFMRENLDAMARKLGEMQAKMVQLEALGERVSGLAGVNPHEISATPGRGGALVEGRPLTMEELQATLADLDRLTGAAHRPADRDGVAPVRPEVRKMMVPTQQPVPMRPPRVLLRLAHRPVHAAARPCTPGWISRPTRAPPSSRPPAAWSSPQECTRRTATWSRSTTATT